MSSNAGRVPPISIVIPVRDGEEVLAQCLQAVMEQTVAPDDYEVIVVDDGSVDRTPHVAGRFPRVRWLSQPPTGAAAARNRGALEARGAVVLFTDADCVPDRDWAENLSRPLLEGRASATLGRCFSEQRQWVAALTQVDLDERYSAVERLKRVDYLNTGNCGIRRDTLVENLLDERFRCIEDVELSFLLHHRQRDMQFVPEARVRHRHRERLWSYLLRKFGSAFETPLICRRYPNETLVDRRAPRHRHLQLLFLGLSLPSWIGAFLSPAATIAGAGFLALSVSFSYPLARRAWRRSSLLGAMAPGFVLLTNMAFILGTIRGIPLCFAGARRTPKPAAGDP